MNFPLQRDGQRLEGEQAGEGPAIVGLHGLTATRRYVLMGSRTLERSGRRVVLYDARGHGASSPAPGGDYSFAAQAADLAAVIESLDAGPVVLIGASMGAHAALTLALERPELVAGLRASSRPPTTPSARACDLAHWDALARGPARGRRRGVRRRLRARARCPRPGATPSRPCCASGSRAHEHPDAVADALEAVPRSRPFESWAQLHAIAVPALVVGSRDEADPAIRWRSRGATREEIPARALRASRRRAARRSRGRVASSRACF